MSIHGQKEAKMKSIEKVYLLAILLLFWYIYWIGKPRAIKDPEIKPRLSDQFNEKPKNYISNEKEERLEKLAKLKIIELSKKNKIPKPDSKAKPKENLKLKPKPKPNSKSDLKSKPKENPKPNPKPKPKPDLKSKPIENQKPKPDLKPKPNENPKPKLDLKPKSDLKPKPKENPKPKSKQDTKPIKNSQSKTEQDPKPKIKNKPKPKPKPNTSPSTKVHALILAYMRTGSTYFGQLVGQYNQTYYHYEPLHYYSSRGNNWTKFSDEFAINLIQNIYKCQFDTPEMSELITNHSLSMGMAWQLPYFKNSCINRKNCSDPIIQTKLCKESEINLIKTVRLRSWALKTLMKQDSKLKVILLVRDPRSLINSRKHGFCGKDM